MHWHIKFVTRFLAITFLFLIILNWNLRDDYTTCVFYVIVFYVLLGKLSIGSDKGHVFFLHRPSIVKISPFCRRHVYTRTMSLPNVYDFYDGDLWHFLFYFVVSNWNYASDYIKKPWDISCKFHLGITRNKKGYCQKACYRLSNKRKMHAVKSQLKTTKYSHAHY